MKYNTHIEKYTEKKHADTHMTVIQASDPPCASSPLSSSLPQIKAKWNKTNERKQNTMLTHGMTFPVLLYSLPPKHASLNSTALFVELYGMRPHTVHFVCCRCSSYLSLLSGLHSMTVPQCEFPLFCWWIFRNFPVFDVMDYVIMNILACLLVYVRLYFSWVYN